MAMADVPKGPGPPSREREGGTSLQERPVVKRPEQYKVILYNDDYTRMEFVVAILEQLFGKGPAEASSTIANRPMGRTLAQSRRRKERPRETRGLARASGLPAVSLCD